MELNNFIDERLIKINLPCKDRNELFQMMYDEAFKYGYVESSFLEGLMSRESVFPTGIKLTITMLQYLILMQIHVKEEFIAIHSARNSNKV